MIPMNTENPIPDEPTGGPSPSGKPDQPMKKPRRHLLGLPPEYKFDPKAKPTPEDLAGITVCFGDDSPHPGQSRTESDGLTTDD